MAFRRSIIQIKADCHPLDFQLVKLQQVYTDGRVIERENPCTDRTSIEAVLYCLKEFLETADELKFDTGNELFNNFRCTLKGAAKDDWDVIIMDIPNPRMVVLFHAAIEAWKSELILLSARQTMVDYLETLVKPRNMTVEAFVNRI